jgi:DNA-binding PadR family transcriptional regulator
MTLNTLQHCLLAYIRSNGSTGYELTKRVSAYRNASHQQIYRELDRLEEKKLLTVKVQPQSGKPDKKIYNTTPKANVLLHSIIQNEQLEIYKLPSFETALDAGLLMSMEKHLGIEKAINQAIGRYRMKLINDKTLTNVERVLIERRIEMLQIEMNASSRLASAALMDREALWPK